MLIENNIEDGIDFFHMDALSSAVAMKVNCDLQLTLMASSLYRLLGSRIGHGYETAKSRHLFRDFVDATAGVMVTEREVVVHFKSGPTIRCCWPLVSTKRTRPCRGSVVSGSSWCSDKRRMESRQKLTCPTKNQTIVSPKGVCGNPG